MTDTASALSAECPRCGEASRLRTRNFSDQAMAALVAWHEVTEQIVALPICDVCYEELREVLIDREAELTEDQHKKTQQKISAKKQDKPSQKITAEKDTAGKKEKTAATKSGKKAG